ncbi:MAG: NAD(P)-dependent oxidoreductase [Olsenella profusa]
MSSTIHSVAFIGTGIMGAPIAGHLLDAGYGLTVHNRTKAKADALVARGATWAPSPGEAASQADVVFTMLGYPTDVERVYLDKGGIIAASRKGAWLVDLTTSSSQLARDIHDAAEVMDKHALDCPVTGGEQGAIDGTLTLMVGAAETDAAPILPLLECFSDTVYYLGAAGRGQTVKLCNQVALASAMVGYADALALAETAGIDGAQMVDIVSHGMGGSVALSKLAPRSVVGDYRPGFLVEHLRKDLGLALMQADDAGMALPGAQNAFDLYDALCKIGGSRLGTQAITLLYQDQETGASVGLDWSLLEQPAEHDHGHHHRDGRQH